MDLILRKYFCCMCYSDKRKKLRQQQLQAKNLVELAQQQKDEVNSRDRAVTKIQCLIRRFLARTRLHKKYEDAIQMANDYWLAEILMAKIEKERRHRELEITKMFAQSYAGDVINTSMLYILQNDACISIQRTWRGHRCRMKLRRRLQSRRKERVGKVQPRPPRITDIALRRNWARTEFVPSAGWLHLTDNGFVMYDMWEHVDDPPEGDRHGLRTRKVFALPTTLRQQHVLLNDYRAWVGLPVHFESAAIDRKRERAKRPNNVKMLLEVSPYGWAQFNLPPVAKKMPIAEDERSLDMEELGRDVFTDFMEKDESGRPIFSADKAEKFLSRLGFDITNGKKKRVFRKGTVTYDLLTGRKVVHTGRPTLTYDEDDDKFDPFASMSSANSAQLHQEANDLSSVGQLSMFSSTTHSAATVATKEQMMVSSSILLSEKHNLLGRSKLSKSISGMITVTTPALQPNSAFLRRHRGAFRESHITSDGINVTGHSNVNSVSFALNDSFITDPGFRGDMDNNNATTANGSRMDEDVSVDMPAAVEDPPLSSLRWGEIDSSLAPLRGRKPQPKKSNLVISLQKRQREAETQLAKDMEEARRDRMLAAWAKSDWAGKVKAAVQRELQRQDGANRSGLMGNLDTDDFNLGASESDSDNDSDSSGLKMRSLYRPPKKTGPSVGVWAKKPRGHYMLRYTWVPQPLLHNAVNDINYASSRRLASETLHPYTPVPLSPSTKAFVSSALASDADLKPYQQKELLRTRLLTVAPSAAAFTSYGTGLRSSTFISAGDDDNEGVDYDLDSGAGDASSLESGFSGSYEADSTRHPQRQVEVSLPILRPFPTIPPPEHDIMTAVSALSQEDSLSVPGSIGSRSLMSYSISADSAADTRNQHSQLSLSQSYSKSRLSRGDTSAVNSFSPTQSRTSQSQSILHDASNVKGKKAARWATTKRRQIPASPSLGFAEDNDDEAVEETTWLTAVTENHYISANDRAALAHEATVSGGIQSNTFGRLKYKPRKYVRTKKEEGPKLHAHHFL